MNYMNFKKSINDLWHFCGLTKKRKKKKIRKKQQNKLNDSFGPIRQYFLTKKNLLRDEIAKLLTDQLCTFARRRVHGKKSTCEAFFYCTFYYDISHIYIVKEILLSSFSLFIYLCIYIYIYIRIYERRPYGSSAY